MNVDARGALCMHYLNCRNINIVYSNCLEMMIPMTHSEGTIK